MLYPCAHTFHHNDRFWILCRLHWFSKSNKVALEQLRADVSWSAFCAARGYDINDNTYQATNEYLDTWCGSVDEEEAFINAGVEHY